MKRAALLVFVTLGVAAAGGSLAATSWRAARPVEVKKADKVTICHATGNGSWVEITPSANGVLSGHDKHPNDIIPPFTYGKNPIKTYPGKNWDAEGQSIYDNGCRAKEPVASEIGIFVKCVDVHAGTYDATFGYESENEVSVTVAVGANNHFSPTPQDRGQPTLFQPGNVPAAFSVSGIPIGTALTWSLTFAGTTSTTTASALYGTHCTAPPPPKPPVSIFPTCVTNGAGTFAATFGYENSGPAAVQVAVGPANRFKPVPLFRGQPIQFVPGRVLNAFTVRGIPNATTISWLLTTGHRTRKATANADLLRKCAAPPPPPSPIRVFVSCVTNGAASYSARFGYENDNTADVAIAIGPANGFTPAPEARGQPTTFQPGTVQEAFTVAGIPNGVSLTWTVSSAGGTRTATSSPGLTSKCPAPPPPPPPPDPEHIGIFVKCVTNHGATFDATFGYQNDSESPVTIPVGVRNRFLPAPGDRGQTTTFQPGNVQRAFTVRGIPRRNTVFWAVTYHGPRVATARANSPSKCGGVSPHFAPIAVFVTCVTHHGGTYDATFGYKNDNPQDETVPVGIANTFLPAPSDRAQPTVFGPGRVLAAVTVRGIPNAAELVWRVARGGTSLAVASSTFPGRCGKPPAPPEPPGPPLPPGPPPRALGVFATCVTITGATYKVTFGYLNLNVDDVIVPVGASNRVAPAKANGQQPDTFSPGLVVRAFTVKGVPVGRAVTWQVTLAPGEVRTATATASTSRKCPLAAPAAPDLGLTKTTGPGTVSVGDRFTSTITVRNRGPRVAFDVLIVDGRLDRRSQLLSAAATRGSCEVRHQPERAVCRVAVLPPGVAVTVKTAWRALAPGRARDIGITSSFRHRDGDRGNNFGVAGVMVRASARGRPVPNYTG